MTQLKRIWTALKKNNNNQTHPNNRMITVETQIEDTSRNHCISREREREREDIYIYIWGIFICDQEGEKGRN